VPALEEQAQMMQNGVESVEPQQKSGHPRLMFGYGTLPTKGESMRRIVTGIVALLAITPMALSVKADIPRVSGYSRPVGFEHTIDLQKYGASKLCTSLLSTSAAARLTGALHLVVVQGYLSSYGASKPDANCNYVPSAAGCAVCVPSEVKSMYLLLWKDRSSIQSSYRAFLNGATFGLSCVHLGTISGVGVRADWIYGCGDGGELIVQVGSENMFVLVGLSKQNAIAEGQRLVKELS
jgi:hypothetical protein